MGVLTICRDKDCPYCAGSGEIRCEASTVGKVYVYQCFSASDGGKMMGGQMLREEPLVKSTFIHDIKLDGGSDFARRFNYVSELFQRSMDSDLSEEERSQAHKEWFDAKFALEMGLPLPI